MERNQLYKDVQKYFPYQLRSDRRRDNISEIIEQKESSRNKQKNKLETKEKRQQRKRSNYLQNY
jgi:hypothetical protein